MPDLRQYCLNKPGAYEDYPFGPEPAVFKVGSKMFALLNETVGQAVISLKCDPGLSDLFRQQYAAVQPGYHLNKKHWNTVVLDGTVPDSEILWMIDHSYELVVKSLPKTERERLVSSVQTSPGKHR
jgi:predicted DNA-binding protein (MmcQ/YjbR family)